VAWNDGPSIFGGIDCSVFATGHCMVCLPSCQCICTVKLQKCPDKAWHREYFDRLSQQNFCLYQPLAMPIGTATIQRRETTTEERILEIEKNAEGTSDWGIAEITVISKSSVAGIVEE
jgi:hypothetical protein